LLKRGIHLLWKGAHSTFSQKNQFLFYIGHKGIKIDKCMMILIG
jgi:hypothetical protein